MCFYLEIKNVQVPWDSILIDFTILLISNETLIQTSMCVTFTHF
jgi:hypothetical protein